MKYEYVIIKEVKGVKCGGSEKRSKVIFDWWTAANIHCEMKTGLKSNLKKCYTPFLVQNRIIDPLFLSFQNIFATTTALNNLLNK